MTKRCFRRSSSATPCYPTHDAFEPSRRNFLAGLGALLGAGALVTLLPACGDRAVGDDDEPDLKLSGGKPDMMPAPVDAGPELRTTGGVADVMHAPLDSGPPPRDSMGKPDQPGAPADGE